MPSPQPSITKSIIAFISKILSAIWLYFPGLLFLGVGYVTIGSLTQGRDVIVQAAEHNISGGVMVLAVTFWAYITWYTSRIITDQKYDDVKGVYKHLPRIMGYTCFIIPQIAIVNLPFLEMSDWALPLIIIAVVFYFLITRFAKGGLLGSDVTVLLIILAISVLGTVINAAMTGDSTVAFLKVLVVLYMLQAALFLYFNITRRRSLDREKANRDEEALKQRMGKQVFKAGVLKVNVSMEESERKFFLIFNAISFIGVLVYALSIVNLPFARSVSSYTIVFIGFGVLLGAGNLISFVSMKIKLNLHVIVIILAVLTNTFLKDPYKVETFTANDMDNGFDQRMDLREYTRAWIEQRKDQIMTVDNFPMIFGLADGGASRSGYWTAACLGVLQDESARFDDHLFMLSGASGGSVGNGAYYSLLEQGVSQGTYEKEAKAFLGNDFLSFTISRMLGPDYFRHVFPLNFWQTRDRASTLEQGMEEPAVGLPLFAKPISDLVTQRGEAVDKPILVINTTRMNDAKPGVISTVKLDTGFTRRLDVLGIMSKEKDLNLSTATVMGARFPYISPGGELVDNNYFVDGGYFDNSGAGAAHETIQAIEFYLNQGLLSDSTENAEIRKRLQFYIIHMMNSPKEKKVGEMPPISPLANDLAAPIITLMNSYGQQTRVNNQRLYNFLDFEKYPNSSNKPFPQRHWIEVNLYDMAEKDQTFSMNWVISQRDLAGMDRMVQENPNLRVLKEWLNNDKSFLD